MIDGVNRISTGIEGLDELLGEGIEKSSIVLVSGGTGTGKTNFCSQCLHHNLFNGKSGIYLSFEEPPEQIKRHVARFGFKFDEFENSGKARFVRIDIYQIAKALKAIFLETRGELMIKEGLPKILPDDFKPEIVVIDSLSALGAVLKEDEYRYFIFQLFSRFKEIGATTFAITESKEDPTRYSRTGIEEFLADGVIVLYYLKHATARLRAVEVLKLRGTKHEERIVPFKITDKGIVVYPKQELLDSV